MQTDTLTFQSYRLPVNPRIGFDTKAGCYVVHVYEGGVCKRRIPCLDHVHAMNKRAEIIRGDES